jgi:DNA polymerase-3 subunit epsilon/exodeoxyribonuclease X
MRKFILLDTETTGIEDEDKIIQLGYIVLGKPSDKAEVYQDFCSTDIDIKIPAMETHNITPEIIDGKPTLVNTNSFKKLNELNSDENIMVIHNAPFDLGMLAKEKFENKMKLIDTLVVSKHLLPDSEFHRLQFFRYQMGLYKIEKAEADSLGIVVKAHDAIGDVLVMKLLMTELIKICQKQFPGIDPIQKMVELTKIIPIMKKVPFGKHKGKNMLDAVNEDIGWFRWALGNMSDMSEELKHNINYYIEESKKINEDLNKNKTSTTNIFMDD